MKTPYPFHSLVLSASLLVAVAVTSVSPFADEAAKKEVENNRPDKGFTLTNDILIEVDAGKKAYLLVPEGKIHPNQPDPEKFGFVELDFTKIEKPLMKINGIYNFPNDPNRGEKLWNALTAEEMRKMYREAGFALLPSERSSESPLAGTKLPHVVMFPTAGLIRISQVTATKNKLAVRLQYRFFDHGIKADQKSDIIL